MDIQKASDKARKEADAQEISNSTTNGWFLSMVLVMAVLFVAREVKPDFAAPDNLLDLMWIIMAGQFITVCCIMNAVNHKLKRFLK